MRQTWSVAIRLIRGGADKSLARPTSRCRRTESIVSLERGVRSCAELQTFSCYRGWKEACQATRAFSTICRREISSSFLLQGKAPKEIHAILTETLGERASSYATVKNWAAQFKRGDFFTCVAPRPGRPETVTTPEFFYHIHELILEDRRISAKSIAEQLGISRERVGPIIHEDWTCGSSPRSGSRNAWTRIKNISGTSRLSNFWNLSGVIQMVSCRDWWPWTKPGYITMTRRQSNNRWSGGIAAQPAPRNSECKNPPEKFSPWFFWDQNGILLIDYLPKGETINTEYHSSLLMQLKDILKEKLREFTKGVLFLHECPGSPGTCNLEETDLPGLPITHPILRICPCRTTICSLDWKNWKVAIFRPTRRSLLPRKPGWTDNFLIFFEWLAKVRATG